MLVTYSEYHFRDAALTAALAAPALAAIAVDAVLRRGRWASAQGEAWAPDEGRRVGRRRRAPPRGPA